MKAAFLWFLLLLAVALMANEPVGVWDFDDPADLAGATIGNDLVLVGNHQAVNGPTAINGATRIGVGSFYRCFHDIPANGGGTLVNEYSIVIDFRIPTLGQWYTFFQTSYQNSNDGDAFINPSGQIGVAQTGYGGYILSPGEWYRLVISVDLGSSYKYYLDGQLLQDGGAQILDGRFALYPQANQNQVLFFADDNGEDNSIDIAQIRIYNVPLNATQAMILGGYGHYIYAGPAPMVPFLQSPTPNSMYVSWHFGGDGYNYVAWGTSPGQLFMNVPATTQTLSSTLKWHTAKLEGLLANTKIYYRCYSDYGVSPIYSFKTPRVLQQSIYGNFRFIIVGDSQTNSAVSTSIVNKIAEKCEELYGENWRDEIALIAHVGDMVGNGTNLSSYIPEFFLPFAPLTHGIPTMIAIGNHEAESANYYNYMHYSDFGGLEGEKYYSFDLARCRFIFLNANINTSQQSIWLAQKVNEAHYDDAITHIFTFIHHPGKSEVWPAGNTAWTRDYVIPLLETNPKSSIIASGHSHNYEHATSRDSRLRRLICGGAGGSLDRWGMYANQTDYPETHISLDQYHWLLVDVNLMDMSYTAKMYSLGHPDLPRDNEVMDEWTDYHWLSQVVPPTALLSAARLSGNRVQLTLKPFNWTFPGMHEEPFFSIGGEISGDSAFTNVLSQRMWDRENIYGDTGSPYWIPIDLNAGMDTRRVILDSSTLTLGIEYWARGWYRCESMHRTTTPGQSFIYQNYAPSCDFHASRTSPTVLQSVSFTDLSAADITAWSWDFDNDGIVDSVERDPVHTYTLPGTYSVRLGIQTEAGYLEHFKPDYITVNAVENSDPSAAEFRTRIYPNPFSDRLTIVSKGGGDVRASVYNLKGQRVRDLELTERRGNELIWQWDGYDGNGRQAANGVYYLRITAGSGIVSHKILYVK